MHLLVHLSLKSSSCVNLIIFYDLERDLLPSVLHVVGNCIPLLSRRWTRHLHAHFIASHHFCALHDRHVLLSRTVDLYLKRDIRPPILKAQDDKQYQASRYTKLQRHDELPLPPSPSTSLAPTPQNGLRALVTYHNYLALNISLGLASIHNITNVTIRSSIVKLLRLYIRAQQHVDRLVVICGNIAC